MILGASRPVRPARATSHGAAQPETTRGPHRPPTQPPPPDSATQTAGPGQLAPSAASGTAAPADREGPGVGPANGAHDSGSPSTASCLGPGRHLLIILCGKNLVPASMVHARSARSQVTLRMDEIPPSPSPEKTQAQSTASPTWALSLRPPSPDEPRWGGGREGEAAVPRNHTHRAPGSWLKAQAAWADTDLTRSGLHVPPSLRRLRFSGCPRPGQQGGPAPLRSAIHTAHPWCVPLSPDRPRAWSPWGAAGQGHVLAVDLTRATCFGLTVS